MRTRMWFIVVSAAGCAPARPSGAPEQAGPSVTPRVEGELEMRCDDGARVSVAVNGQSRVQLAPPPAAGAECKLQMLGVPGSFGPVTTTTRRVECSVAVDSFRCAATAGQ